MLTTAGGDQGGGAAAPSNSAPRPDVSIHAGPAPDTSVSPTGPPVVLGCFDSTGKCNLLAHQKASAALRRRSDVDLRAQAARLGVPNSAQLGRESLLHVLMETEELAELTFPAPPTWTQFDAACKKKLGKHLTFEYFPGAAGGAAASGGGAAATAGNGGGVQASPRGVHVKVEILKSPLS